MKNAGRTHRGEWTGCSSCIRYFALCMSLFWLASAGHHLSGVHPIFRIERTFNRSHQFERGSMFGFEVLHLAETHAVLACTRTAEAQGAQHQTFVELSGGLDLTRIAQIEQIEEMKVAVARGPGPGGG